MSRSRAALRFSSLLLLLLPHIDLEGCSTESATIELGNGARRIPGICIDNACCFTIFAQFLDPLCLCCLVEVLLKFLPLDLLCETANPHLLLTFELFEWV